MGQVAAEVPVSSLGLIISRTMWYTLSYVT